MKINLYPADISGCGYYRLILPAMFLKEHHTINISMEMKKQDILNPEFDIAVLQRPYHQDIFANMICLLEKDIKVIIDIDDWLLNVDEKNPCKTFYSLGTIRQNIKFFFSHCSAIITTNNYLAKLLSSFNENIFVFENYLNCKLWNFHLHKRLHFKNNYDKIIIGYHGSDTHENDLNIIKDDINKIMEEFPNVLFKSVGFDIRNIKGFLNKKFNKRVIFRYGESPARFGRHLYNFDIGIAPLVDSEFNRAKSNIKYLEYSALQIPCIASPVRPYQETIDNNRNGILSKDFYFDLKQLILSKDIRQMLGTNAYDYIQKNYDIKNNFYKLNDIYEQIMNIKDESYNKFLELLNQYK